MTEPAAIPETYVLAHLREALATDERVAELGIDLTIASGTLVLTGKVSSPSQRDAAGELARSHGPHLDVRNDLEVVDAEAPPSSPEHVT